MLLCGSFQKVVYDDDTLHCFIWLNSNHVCGTRGIIAALCLYDACCCLAVGWERLQGSY